MNVYEYKIILLCNYVYLEVIQLAELTCVHAYIIDQFVELIVRNTNLVISMITNMVLWCLYDQ